MRSVSEDNLRVKALIITVVRRQDKMILKYNKKEYAYSFVVFFLLFYIYNATFQEVFFLSRMIGVLLVLFTSTFVF